MIGSQIQTNAILIHHHLKTHGVEVTCHDVIQSGRSFVLGTGAAMNASKKDEFIAILSGDTSSEKTEFSLLPENLLYSGCKTLIWYQKPQTVDLPFRIENDVRLVTVNLPAHVFIYHDGEFYAFAFKGKGRPTMDTKLFNTPTGNAYDDGHVCTGNVSLVKRYDVGYITELQRFFLEATNTDVHNLAFKEISATSHVDDLLQIWEQLADLKAADVSKLLVPFSPKGKHSRQATLGDVVGSMEVL